MKLFFTALLMIIVFNQALANDWAGENQDRCVIHLSKSFYVSGEVIWYKVYFPAAFKNRNIAIKTGLWTDTGQEVATVFHKTMGKSFVQGYFNLPFDIQTGLYHLVVLGTTLENKHSLHLAETLIPVYNDLDPPISPEIINSTEKEGEAKTLSEPSLKVSIKILEEPVRRRGAVKAKISVQDEYGLAVPANLSVSVRDFELTDASIPSQNNIVEGKLLDTNLGMKMDSVISFSGTIKDTTGQPLQAQLLGIYSSKEQTFVYTKSDKEGRLSFELPDFYGSKPIQFLDYQYEHIQVELQSDIPFEKNGELVYTPEVLAYLNASRQRKKIYQMYNGFEYDLAPEIPHFDVQSFDPDQSFQIQNYERFPSIPVFFREVLTPLKFREDKTGKITAKMFNPAYEIRDFYPGKPVFIVDGKLTRDVSYVAGLDIDQLERVDLFYDFQKLRQRFNALGINGVVLIKTNLADLSIPESEETDIFTINGLQPGVKFPGQVLDESNLAPRKPVLQPQLYWNPNHQTNEQGEVELSFIQSDDLSAFRIEVVVQGQNGEWGHGTMEYQVVP